MSFNLSVCIVYVNLRSFSFVASGGALGRGPALFVRRRGVRSSPSCGPRADLDLTFPPPIRRRRDDASDRPEASPSFDSDATSSDDDASVDASNNGVLVTEVRSNVFSALVRSFTPKPSGTNIERMRFPKSLRPPAFSFAMSLKRSAMDAINTWAAAARFSNLSALERLYTTSTRSVFFSSKKPRPF